MGDVTGKTISPGLVDTLVALHRAVLATRPWHDRQRPAVASRATAGS